MFDVLNPAHETLPSAQNAAMTARPPHHEGADRHTRSRDAGPWMMRMLDEIDYGMLLVTPDAQVSYLNHAAQLELDGQHPLQLLGSTLRAHRALDVAPLYDALAAAQRGLRRLVTLGEGGQRVCVSVVPLPAAGSMDMRVTLLVLGKRQVCEQLSVQGYARSVGLTPAETRVLEQLCAGARPGQVATSTGVAVSTIRTQIGSIRAKTGAGSIRELVRQVAVLPPLVGALRGNGASRSMTGGTARPTTGGT
jgi:DNA-binding CsgD family transcriptional regulator